MHFNSVDEVIITHAEECEFVVYISSELPSSKIEVVVEKLDFLYDSTSSVAVISRESAADIFAKKFSVVNELLIEPHPNFSNDQLTSFLSQHNYDLIIVLGIQNKYLDEISLMLDKKTTNAKLEVDLTQLANNVKHLKSLLRSQTQVMGMVKANSYGSGLDVIGRFLAQQYCDYLGVATVDEGITVRNLNSEIPIFLLSCDEREFQRIVDFQIEPTLYSIRIASAFEDFLQSQGIKNYPVHIELDTGMNRLGFKESDLDDLRQYLQSSNAIQLKSIFSHFTSSEVVEEKEFTLEQFDKFENWFSFLTKDLGYAVNKHIQNSHGLLSLPNSKVDLSRLGISMYGYTSEAYASDNIRPILKLVSKVLQVKKVNKGETVGYNRTDTIREDGRLAVIQMGYGDGMPRLAGRRNFSVKIGEEKFPIVGNVCMDLLMVELGKNLTISEGDEVIFFDSQNTVNSLAKAAQTSIYEIITQIADRIKRQYRFKTLGNV